LGRFPKPGESQRVRIIAKLWVEDLRFPGAASTLGEDLEQEREQVKGSFSQRFEKEERKRLL